MTKQELSQLYYLNREIELLKKRIEELECIAASTTGRITGLPHASGITDKTGKYAVELAELKEMLEVSLKKCFYELKRLYRFVEGIEDSQMRMILSLRYINGLSWNQVAVSIGGGNTEKGIQMMANRFLSKI